MDEQALHSLGLWIKRRRKALDLTQDALAALVGCSKELIVKIEGDARRPSREIAALLATHLQLAPDEVDAFIRCARAELAPDRLPAPTASVPRAGFPPRPPAERPRSNLPVQLSSFLGRARELAELTALLHRSDVRLVTLTGAGGTGKTRLALQAAAELALTPSPPSTSPSTLRPFGFAQGNLRSGEPGSGGTSGRGSPVATGEGSELSSPPRPPQPSETLSLPRPLRRERSELSSPPRLPQPSETLSPPRLPQQARGPGGEVPFPDGVFFVDLAPISDPELVAAAIAQTLGVQETGSLPIRERLKSFVHTRKLLLLLDNYEQLLAAAPLIAELLAAAPGLKVLATSRAALHLSGEHEYAVPPLALPPTAVRTLERSNVPTFNAELTQYAAVQLFIQRAQAAKADFAVTNATAAAVAEICIRLDGLPLAIELAAARIKLFTPDALLAHLSHPLALLTGGARDLPARQQTIRSTIDWSYNLLSEDEQRLLRGLGVFVGGFTLDAAEAVTDFGFSIFDFRLSADAEAIQNPKSKIQNSLDGLASLVDHSLLTLLEPAGGEPRYGMLELVREYALERMREAGEEAETRRRHAAHVLELVEAVGPKVGGPESHQALDRLEAELPNIRAAIAWAGEAGEPDLALRLASALLPLWLNLGHRGEGSAMLQAALSWPGAGTPILRARALSVLGRLNWRDPNRWPETRAALEESLEIFRALGDLDGSSTVLSDLAFVELLSGDVERSELLEEESLRDARAAQNKERAAWALQGLAWKAFLQGDDVRGSAVLDESQSLFEELKHQFGYAAGLLMLALAVQRRGDGARGVALHMEHVTLLREQGQSIAWPLRYLGWALVRDGNYKQATDVLQESLAELREGRAFERMPQVLNILGEAALGCSDNAMARASFQESQALCRELGDTWDTAGALLGEGHVAIAEGDARAASACYMEALKVFSGLPDWDDRRRRAGVAACLSGLAGAAVRSAPDRAARMYGAAAALRATVGPAALAEFDLAYPLPANRAAEDRALVAARAALGEEAFQAAWAAGQALTFEQAVAEALDR